MRIQTLTLQVTTKGEGDLVDLTRSLQEMLEQSRLKEGSMLVFVIGSTAGITSFEYEPGLIQDMQDIYEKLAPHKHPYEHNKTWSDDNGFSHIRAALQGPSLTVPFANGRLMLGTWQQVVLAEFDTRPRSRSVVVQFTGQ